MGGPGDRQLSLAQPGTMEIKLSKGPDRISRPPVGQRPPGPTYAACFLQPASLSPQCMQSNKPLLLVVLGARCAGRSCVVSNRRGQSCSVHSSQRRVVAFSSTSRARVLHEMLPAQRPSIPHTPLPFVSAQLFSSAPLSLFGMTAGGDRRLRLNRAPQQGMQKRGRKKQRDAHRAGGVDMRKMKSAGPTKGEKRLR